MDASPLDSVPTQRTLSKMSHTGVSSTPDASGPAGESTAAIGPVPNTHSGGSLSDRAYSCSGSLTAIRVISCAKVSTNACPLVSGNPRQRATRSSQASRASGVCSLSFFSEAMAPFQDRNLFQKGKERSHAFPAERTVTIRSFQARPVRGNQEGLAVQHYTWLVPHTRAERR